MTLKFIWNDLKRLNQNTLDCVVKTSRKYWPWTEILFSIRIPTLSMSYLFDSRFILYFIYSFISFLVIYVSHGTWNYSGEAWIKVEFCCKTCFIKYISSLHSQTNLYMSKCFLGFKLHMWTHLKIQCRESKSSSSCRNTLLKV